MSITVSFFPDINLLLIPVFSLTLFISSLGLNFLRVLLIYTLSTLFVLLTYAFADIRILDSLNLAFTTISSGGFLPKNNLSTIINNDFQILILWYLFFLL